MAINLEKILKDLEKGEVSEQIEAFQKIKDFVTETIQAEQKKHEEQANNLQSTLDRLNNQ